MSMTIALDPRDFISRTPSDNRRVQWTAGRLRHVVTALAGDTVIIVIDGIAYHGATLGQPFDGGPSRGMRLPVTTLLSDGTKQTTNFRVPDVGVIIPLGTGIVDSARSLAQRSIMAESSAAIAHVRDNGLARDAGTWGAWKGEPMVDGVSVTYTPHTGNDYFRDQWGKFDYASVSLRTLAALTA